MELREFVRDSLKAIVDGISEASKDPRIAPQLIVPEQDSKTLVTLQGNQQPAFLVDFDVAVTVADKSTTGGGAGITVLSVAMLKGKKSKETETTSVSRIKFSVPVCFKL